MRYANLEQRLLQHCVEIPAGEPHAGCWMWLGKPQKNGYAKISVRARPWPANPVQVWVHRLAFTVFHDKPIRPFFDIDHRCEFRLCIHPNHLRERASAKNRSHGGKKGRAMQLRR